MSASERDVPVQQPCGGVSMRDLLASCAAADAVSRPPAAPVAQAPGTSSEEQVRKAA
ncbi:hypothetical protein OOK36_25925 [Streptomyces sp. NBC_00365]|jgi:hypothetical protein|uniref:hypothetical protein n=1 Tax=Streptomyces sp. NBC_00365 TaxID=2975726 RepID=UPI002257A63A|nr:hypothetical protein [Streptomyces sp. NBC_00365]MCX5092248.1 hypothetical protein [Streptomyces sp. NBC_00365]